jgi:chitin disaccharide deacetylase
MATAWQAEDWSSHDLALEEVGSVSQYLQLKGASSEEVSLEVGVAHPKRDPRPAGLLIINADDWGRDVHTTGRILDCVLRGSISSVSAMVFMEDSEQAAAIARERGIDTGLHLNLTTPFSAASCPSKLKEHQQKLAQYLCRCSLARTVYHPWLGRSFEYAVKAQIEEYSRIYGMQPKRFDGHHHMHLSANVLFGNLLPPGTIVRRHFSRESGEKPLRNRLFRKFTHILLARAHRFADFFFSLPPLDPPVRLQRIFSLAYRSVVELETHPTNPEEYRFLTDGELFSRAANLPIASHFIVSPNRRLGK